MESSNARRLCLVTRSKEEEKDEERKENKSRKTSIYTTNLHGASSDIEKVRTR